MGKVLGGKRMPREFGLPSPFRCAKLFGMAAVEIDVRYVAYLARLALSPEEEQKIGAQLGQVLSYIEKLNELDVSEVEPTAHAVPLINITRPDQVRPSLPHDEALRNAPLAANGLFVVPKIVE
jgi:aspartyl-tRNA(Asn)/glutamyl-tRNA(Gln) amidotransferase subunit C